MRPDLEIIQHWITSGSNVLDLGCGDGSLLQYLKQTKNVADIGLEIDEIKIAEGSQIVDKTLADLSLRSELNIIIIGIYRSGTEWVYNPRSDTKFHAGDTMIAIGETSDLLKMEKQAANA